MQISQNFVAFSQYMNFNISSCYNYVITTLWINPNWKTKKGMKKFVLLLHYENCKLLIQIWFSGRTMALESMCTAFLKKFIPDFVEDRRMTLTDIAERSMKKGKAAEQVTGKMTSIFNNFGWINTGEQKVNRGTEPHLKSLANKQVDNICDILQFFPIFEDWSSEIVNSGNYVVNCAKNINIDR